MENYFASKAILFQGCGTEPPRSAVINIEDEYGKRLMKLLTRQQEVSTYGVDSGDFHAKNLDVQSKGSRFDLVTPEGEIAIWTPLLGRVNVLNVIAAAAAARARGVELSAIADAALHMDRVPGPV